MSFNDSKKLQGEKILNLLGFFERVKLQVDFGQARAKSAERPNGFTVFADSQIKPSRSEKFVSQYAEAYAKVDWEKDGAEITYICEYSTFNLLDGSMEAGDEYRNVGTGGSIANNKLGQKIFTSPVC